MTHLDRIDPEWAWSPYDGKDGRWDRGLAAHLHRRAGFGATSEQLDKAAALSVQEAVDAVCGESESESLQAQYESLIDTVIAGGEVAGLASAWTYRLLTTPAQLREKMTLFWHGHFATSAAKVDDVKLMNNQNQLFRKYAMGDFSELLQAVSKDPAMLIYLDSVTNRKAHPNENYAREVMELFCLGEGNYSEFDVVQLARCFTGWEIKRGKYRFNRYQHDFEEKTIFGKKGEFGGEDGVRLVLDHESGPEFIASKLVRYFVRDEPAASPDLVAPLAQQLRSDRWRIEPTVRRILGSQLFFSQAAYGAKVRSPVELVSGVLRSLHGSTSANKVAEGCRQLGQGLFYPPNVKGWDGGRAWINSSTLLGRTNLMKRILDDSKTRYSGGDMTKLLARYNIEGPEQMVNWFAELLLAAPLSEPLVDELVKASKAEKDLNRRAKRVVYMLCALPECQLA